MSLQHILVSRSKSEKSFPRSYDIDEDEDDLLDDVIDGGIKDADDLDDRAARFLLYWTTITKVC